MDRKPAPKICAVPGCSNRPVGRGWCHAHYGRWRRWGDVLAEVPLGGRGHAERFWAKVDRSGGPGACWPWLGGIGRGGYGTFTARGFPGTTPSGHIYAHRAAYCLTHGNLPGNQYILHRCDNPPCCNPAHLFPGDAASNMADRDRKGRQARGEHNGGGRRLNEAQVRAIRERFSAGGISQQRLADEYGVSQGLISKIVRGRLWAGA